MAVELPIVPRVDSLIIGDDDPWYDRAVKAQAATFALPIPWPVNYLPAFKGAGIFAGNVDFDILLVE